ncbi:hypothetical protein GGQ57_001208 [Parabacteroides faecis]|uniref:Uncharacterized protein n=1 Tax=Parabacteroides faecis TaxID=1217282 RepID=A0ABR6KKH9_9BACT|nr:hypothetical protein [Parabacteroides faecis]
MSVKVLMNNENNAVFYFIFSMIGKCCLRFGMTVSY